MVRLLTLLLTLLCPVGAYPKGPPLSACTEMFPVGHGKDAQQSAPPYRLYLSSTTFTLGGTIHGPWPPRSLH